MVNGPSNTTVTLNDGTSNSFSADIIAEMNIDSKFEKTKTLSKNETLTINSPMLVKGKLTADNVVDFKKKVTFFDSFTIN